MPGMKLNQISEPILEASWVWMEAWLCTDGRDLRGCWEPVIGYKGDCTLQSQGEAMLCSHQRLWPYPWRSIHRESWGQKGQIRKEAVGPGGHSPMRWVCERTLGKTFRGWAQDWSGSEAPSRTRTGQARGRSNEGQVEETSPLEQVLMFSFGTDVFTSLHANQQCQTGETLAPNTERQFLDSPKLTCYDRWLVFALV